MKALYGPVCPVDRKQTLGAGFLGPPARDAVDCLTGCFPGLLLYSVPLNHEGLSHVGEVKIVVELRRGPDLPDLEPSVVRRIRGDKVGFLSVFEGELDIFHKRGLISLDGEVIMTLAPHDVGGNAPLCQKGVCGDVLPLDLDGVKEGDRRLDLVGLFEFVIESCRKDAYFFWV